MIDRETFIMTYDNFDKEVVVEIIDIYIAEYPDRMAALRKAIDDQNFDALNKHSHSLKGVVANFYDDPTYQLARRLENLGKEHVSDGAEDIFQQLKLASSALLEELKELRHQYL